MNTRDRTQHHIAVLEATIDRLTRERDMALAEIGRLETALLARAMEVGTAQAERDEARAEADRSHELANHNWEVANRLTAERDSAQRQLGQSEKGRIWEQERANAASATIVTLRGELDEARADAEAAWDHAHRSWDETEVFCALLRDIEFSCELAGPERCWWCGSTREQGHTPDCRLAAALEKHDGTSRRSG